MSDFEPANRFVVDQAWWMASELCRKNSRLATYWEVFEDGFYEGPAVLDTLRQEGRVFFNQKGRIHFLGLEDAPEPIPFGEGIAEDDAHALVRRIAKMMGWSTPSADPTTRRSLTYRVVSAVMTHVLYHRDPWKSVDGGLIHDDYGHTSRPEHFTTFSGADAARLADEPPQFWAIQRDGRTVALLDDRATLYRRSVPPQDLMVVYSYRERHLHRHLIASSRPEGLVLDRKNEPFRATQRAVSVRSARRHSDAPRKTRPGGRDLASGD